MSPDENDTISDETDIGADRNRQERAANNVLNCAPSRQNGNAMMGNFADSGLQRRAGGLFMYLEIK